MIRSAVLLLLSGTLLQSAQPNIDRLDFKSWHQLDAEILRELADLGGPVTVDAANPQPWVRIVSPIDQSELSGPADVTVQINASAGDKKVELRSNGELIETSTAPTFIHILKGLKAGGYALTARVIDVEGNTKEQAVSVTVFDSKTKDSVPWKEEFPFGDETASDEGKTTAERKPSSMASKESKAT